MPKTDTDRQKLRDEHPDSWIPVSKGDYIEGELIDVVDAWSDQRQGGSFYPMLVIRASSAEGYEPGQELRVHCFGAVLYREIQRHRPEVGEPIRITYTGVGEAKTGLNPPELYRVLVKGRKDAAKRAYGRIFGEPEPPAKQESLPEPDLPADTEGLPEPEDFPF